MHADPPRRPRKPRRRWRWHVPPALMDEGESLQGVQILDEHPGPLGLLLWESFRDVTLWGGVPEGEREGLFAAGAHAARLRRIEESGAEAALRALIAAAAEVCRDPAAADGEQVMTACRGIADWAARRGSPRTALALATAGAVAAPRHPGTAFRVGQLARDNGEHARAETWFRRTVGLGRQARDWAAYGEAFLALGEVYVHRGNHPAAGRFLVRALRAARRHGLRDLQARALHALATVSPHGGEGGEAEAYAAEAFRAYGPRHPRLPVLARDVAHGWLTQGRVAPALDVFRAVLPHLHDPCERLMGLGDLGRAAGAAGERREFEQAWDAVWAHAHDWDARRHAARSLLDLAHGAAALRDWTRAERAAATAREIASRRDESRIVLDAEAVLDAARKREVEPLAPPGGARDLPPLARDLIRSLEPGAAAG
jgi:tetratricopeptide (TPR) repeat protein